MSNLKYYLENAKKNKWAVGQFNFSTLEQLRGIIEAARELKSPVILGTSEGEAGYLGIEEAVAIVEISRKKYGFEDIFLNLDHGKDPELVKKAADSGYSAVHFDGSALTLPENIRLSKELARYAHKKGVLFEGEIGAIRGESSVHEGGISIDEKDLASPDDAYEYIKETGADLLAAAVGNIHGIYAERKKIRFDLIRDICGKSGAFFVLHGGSGIEDNDIKEAISSGVSKINVNTELRAAWREALDEVLRKDGKEVKPYKIMPLVEEAVKNKVKEKINLFASSGKIK